MIHHPFGPSKLGRIDACPGSLAMEEKAIAEGLVIEEFAEAVEEGTSLHALIDQSVALPDDLSDEHRSLVVRAREYVAAKTVGATRVDYEKRRFLWPKDHSEDDDPLIWGTPDVIACMPGYVWICDFKFGWAEPSLAEVEWQIRSYSAMAMHAAFRHQAKAAVFHVRSGTELTAEYSDWRKIRDQIAAVIQRTKDSPNERNPGPHCRYCKGKLACPEFQALMGEATLPAVKGERFQVAPAALARYLDLAALVAPWADRMRDFAKDQIASSPEIAAQMRALGWELTTITVNRKESPPRVDIQRRLKKVRE